MNKYKEYLEKAHKNYTGSSSLEDLYVFNKTSRNQLKKLKELKESDYQFSIVDECNEEVGVIYPYYDYRNEIIDLMIKSIEDDINQVKALIYEILEDGELFD